MPMIERPGGAIWYEITDLAPLLLAPGESPFVPLSVMREIHALIPDSETQSFPGVRHALAFSHGAACSQALRGFLARCERAGG